jgi:hypothetical protein
MRRRSGAPTLRPDPASLLVACRVATPESEVRWLAVAGRLSAAPLSREVQALDWGSLEAGGAEPSDDEPGEREVLRMRVRTHVKSKLQRAR